MCLIKKMSISFITSCISGRSLSQRLSIIFKRDQETNCSKTNYSPQGYCHQKAGRRGKVADDAAKKWLIKQAIWQINLSAPQKNPRPKFDVSTPNTVHQADPFLPHDTPGRGRRRKTYNGRWSMLPAVSKGPNSWPRKTAEVANALKKITVASLWIGHSCFRSTLAKHSWALSTKKWRNTKQTFVEGVRRCTGTRWSWKDNRTLAEGLFRHKYAVETACLRGSGPPLRSQVYPTFLRRINKWLGWLTRNLLKPSKKRLFLLSLRSLFNCALSEKKIKNSPPMSIFVTCIRLVSWKAGSSGPLIPSGLWKLSCCEAQRANCVLSARRPETGVCA